MLWPVCYGLLNTEVQGEAHTDSPQGRSVFQGAPEQGMCQAYETTLLEAWR